MVREVDRFLVARKRRNQLKLIVSPRLCSNRATETSATVEPYVDQHGIPEELRGRQFPDIDSLHDELDVLDLSDCKFLLNDAGFVTMQDPEHNRATRFIRNELEKYRTGWISGSWGICDQDNVQQINKLTPSGKTAKREPDVNFWSYKRCTKIDGELTVKRRPGSRFDVDPDVFFQFSWGNKEGKEFAAMNDMLCIGGVGAGNTGPRVGFLIKTRKAGGAEIGFDVYKVYNGFKVDDSIARTNGCECFYYDGSGTEDVIIEVTPEDFGFEGVWANLCPSFKLSLAKLWSRVF